VLDRDFGLELALANGAFLGDGCVAACEHGLVGGTQDGFARLGLEGARRLRHRPDGQDRHRLDLEAQADDLRMGAQAGLDLARDRSGGAQRLRQRQGEQRLLAQHFQELDDALRQLDGILRRISPAAAVEGEVEQAGEPPRLGDAKGRLTLDRDLLEVGRHLFEHEALLLHADGNGHQCRRSGVIEAGKPRPVADDAAALEHHQVRRGVDLDEADAEHGSFPR